MKYLTDAQTSYRFVENLRSLGFHVETVAEHGLEKEKRDSNLVGWARANGFVWITFDDLKAVSGQEVFREVRDRGGKVIRIGGGPDQPPERSTGRFLFWLPQWKPDLERGDGIGTISDLRNNWRWVPREQLQAHEPGDVLEFDPDPHYFERYLFDVDARKTQPRQPPPPRRNVDHRQASLNLPDDQAG